LHQRAWEPYLTTAATGAISLVREMEKRENRKKTGEKKERRQERKKNWKEERTRIQKEKKNSTGEREEGEARV
jgi:hypothetical protein